VELSGLGFDPLTGAFCPEDSPCSASDDDRNFVGDIGLRKRSELTTLNFNVSRSLAPSSNGTEVVRDQFRFYVNRTVTQRLSASAASVYIEESAVAGAERVDRTYLTVDATLTWRLTSTLSTYGTYTYISNEYDRTINKTEATNNRLYVGFSYRGVGFRR
jgi:predicted porin